MRPWTATMRPVLGSSPKTSAPPPSPSLTTQQPNSSGPREPAFNKTSLTALTSSTLNGSTRRLACTSPVNGFSRSTGSVPKRLGW